MRGFLVVFALAFVSCDYSLDLKAFLTTSRVIPPDTKITSLTFSHAPLTVHKAFDPNVPDSRYTMANGSDPIQVTAVLASNKATLTINGVSVNSGNPSGDITLPNVLPAADNLITLVVSAPGVPSNTYTVAVARDNPNNADATLSQLSLSGMTLSPAFTALNTNYTATTLDTVNSTILNAVSSQSGRPIKFTTNNWSSFTDYSVSQTVSFSAPVETLIVRCTAVDATVKDYTISINRLPPFTLTPSDIVVPIGGSASVQLSGGTPAYTMSQTSGDPGHTFGVSGSTLTFTAGGSVSDNGFVLVKDSTGKAANLGYHVVAKHILVPAQISVKVNTAVTFDVSGGTGPYTGMVQTGGGTLTPGAPTTSTTFTYTAPGTGGSAVIRFKDASGSFYYTDVEITSNNMALTPNYVKPGQTVGLVPTGMTPSYRFKLTNRYRVGTTSDYVTLNGSFDETLLHLYSGTPMPLVIPATWTGGAIYIRVFYNNSTAGEFYDVKVDIQSN